MKSEQGSQSKKAAYKRVAVDYACESASQRDIDHPIESGNGSDGAVAAQTKVSKEDNCGNRSNSERMKNASLNIKVLELQHSRSGNDEGPIAIAGTRS